MSVPVLASVVEDESPRFERCPACGSEHIRLRMRLRLGVQAFPSLSAAIRECFTCTHRFMATTEEEQRAIESIYDGEYSGFRVDPVFHTRVREAVQRDFVTRIPPPAEILDVGCGNGEFLLAAREAGYETWGIDISEDAARICREHGLLAESGDFLTRAFDRQFDVITMWDVLEHLRQPSAFVARAAELLKPGGYLIVKTPGYGGGNFAPIALYNPLAKSLLGAPDHVQYFNPGSMQALLARFFPEIQWLPPQGFRSKPPSRSLKKRISRRVVACINRASQNRNLYAAARKARAA